MTFSDRFPTEIEFEIDRTQLRRYLRLKSILACCGILGPLTCGLGVSLGTAYLERRPNISYSSMWGCLAQFAFFGLLVGLLLGMFIYASLFHLATRRWSTHLRLLVEGPYLRIISGAFVITDRRVHFRSIADYFTEQGPLLRRFGLKALNFHYSGSAALMFPIVGLVDADSVRDQLCEIDASRENDH